MESPELIVRSRSLIDLIDLAITASRELRTTEPASPLADALHAAASEVSDEVRALAVT